MLISEKLLHFIWQHQYLQNTNLSTDEGEALQIINQGTYNTNQGPDFLDATIMIGDIKLIGNIELHINSSDWKAHQHQSDLNFNTVILHVIWNNDTEIINEKGNKIPQLTISYLVPKLLLNRYRDLMDTPDLIPCANYVSTINPLIWSNWKERLTIERLEQKTTGILLQFEESNKHWEEVLWWSIAYSYGLKLNAELFSQMAKTIAVNVLARNKIHPIKIEALLFGQTNLLNKQYVDIYPQMLQEEYQFFQKKYSLKQVEIQPSFLRMRPSGFPTIRLAHLASLVHKSSHLFSIIKETEDIESIKAIFNTQTSYYWNNHYTFDNPSVEQAKHIGKTMIGNIIINAVIPVLFAYAKYNDDESIKTRVINWLNDLPAENNTVMNRWESMGIDNKTACDSQGLLQLSKFYCGEKRCLECSIGNKIIGAAKLN